MPVFTVHEPPPRDGDDEAAAADRFVFVRDKFSLWAFLFAPLWMLWRRLWIVLLLYIVVMAALQAGLWALGASSGVKFAVGVLVSLLIGFEASSLRRWTYARRNWISHGVVVADEVLDGGRSLVLEQAAARLDVQKATLCRALGAEA